MDHVEMRNEFVILYNNVMSNQAPGLNDYEISVFLTKGQDETLKNYYNPKGNKYQEGSDDSPKRQIDFSNLIESSALSVFDTTSHLDYVKIDPRSQVFVLPSHTENNVKYEDVMFIQNEYASTSSDATNMADYISVLPISHTEYQRLMTKPYKWPVHGQAWRMLKQYTSNTNDSTTCVEVVSKETITNYVMVYVRKPKPIIVADLGQNSGVSLNGYTQAMDCELDSIVHEEIVQRAVELAKAAYVGDLNATIQMGQRSE